MKKRQSHHINKFRLNRDAKLKSKKAAKSALTSDSSSVAFWDAEYKESGSNQSNLALSDNPSEDLIKFTRWLERDYGRVFLNPTVSVLDLGCGNGRNLIYMSESYGVHGTGYDISVEAISQAKKKSKDLQLTYEARSIAEPIPLPDASQTIVLDMMASHFLTHAKRKELHKEIFRVLKPGGWLFLKTFLLDEDEHAERLLKENPGEEAGSYIHPQIGVAEYVFTEDALVEELSEYFFVHKVTKSHRHLQKGKAFKRRSMSLYIQKAA